MSKNDFHSAADAAAIEELWLSQWIYSKSARFCGQNTRQLLGIGVGIFFQNDNINTLDEDAKLRLTNGF